MKTLFFSLCLLAISPLVASADCPACKAAAKAQAKVTCDCEATGACKCGNSCQCPGCAVKAAVTIDIPPGTPYVERRWVGPFGRQRIFIRYRR